MYLGWIPIAAVMAGSLQVPRDAVKIELGKQLDLAMSSKPIAHRGQKLSIVGLGTVTFQREEVRMKLNAPVPTRTVEVPPGLYGLRWGNFPKTEPDTVPMPLTFEQGAFLRATIKASVLQYSDVEYRISGAVFDAKGKLLGTASHIEKVQYIRLGQMPTMFRDIELDFGGSAAYRDAAYAVFSISEPTVPRPPDATLVIQIDLVKVK